MDIINLPTLRHAPMVEPTLLGDRSPTELAEVVAQYLYGCIPAYVGDELAKMGVLTPDWRDRLKDIDKRLHPYNGA